MVRLIGGLIGLTFTAALVVGAVLPREEAPENKYAKFYKHPEDVAFQQDGPLGFGVLGTFDRGQLQRGFQVYKEVCAACHGLHRIAFRDLSGIGFSEPEIKALAKNWPVEVAAVDDKTGEPTTRKATPADKIPSPYPNEVAARAANNNALPPDLSLITKARHDGVNYAHALLVGYKETPPKGWETPEGLYFNEHFPNLNIAMPPPIVADDQVTYADGTKATVDQMATDVAAFLQWTAEPKLETRRRTGLAVMIFLTILTAFAYLTYRKVWSDIKGAKTA
ncbi:MAG: cytochrome c1 [Alphaproteobacteria bacterium]|nr:cytochrome c1 [Alphaproteobacteria bacterium]